MSSGRKKPQSSLQLPLLSDSALPAWLQIVRTYQTVARRLDRVLSDAGISLPQFDVLANLGMSEGLTQQELAAKLLVTKGNVCGLLDRMEKSDLVERRPDPIDRRINRIFLTDAGRLALQAAFGPHLRIVQQALSPLSGSERDALISILHRIQQTEFED